MDGIINGGSGLLQNFGYAILFMIAMLGLILTLRFAMAASARSKQAARDAAAERRLIAIETSLDEMRERLERLERSSHPVGGPTRTP